MSDKPQPPEFPVEWYQHCPKAQEAAEWYSHLAPEKEYHIPDYAECAFTRQGNGMGCETCGKFMTRPYLHHKVDEEFLPKIEQFYRDCEQYEKDLAAWQKENNKEDKPPLPKSLMLEEQEAIMLLTLLAEGEMIREKFENMGFPLKISLSDLSEKVRKLCWEFHNDKA